MHPLNRENIKEYLKAPRYLTIAESKYEKRLLRLDLYLAKGVWHFSFNDVKTGQGHAKSDKLKMALKQLNDTGFKVLFFDSATEYYQYIIDFLS